ncbi:Tat (Twin-arginine translocation) pathway signal sequence domain protein [Enhygromyxa salina]|uniref:Tat (Twin-arginine translocation) pathway signal sequence domain protein n=1 Tax=Enhygromyxa salina TaxID=215803 RepID=A0A0C1ZPC4_9BACT|nr:DUF1552 domain-containing protein [Enhygromyxa salina]KIG19479.1 Tat (Twin-arginine translocation) pathway signal sequence domain protein [Enhygromyxa salina]
MKTTHDTRSRRRRAAAQSPKSPALRRRQFLQAAGVGGASLFLPSISRNSHAGPNDGPPCRLVVFFHEHGVYYDSWKMRLPNSPASDLLDFEFELGGLTQAEFSPILAPLHGHRDKMIVLDGLAYLTAMSDPYGDGHAKGWMTAMTGNYARETYDEVKSHALTPSFDQVIKQIVRDKDPTLTDLASLEYGIRPWDGTFHQMHYGLDPQGSAVKVPHVVDPAAAFATLFPDTQGDPVAAARTDVLARAAAQYEQLMPRLSSEDQSKLEQHRSLISDLQNRVEALENLVCTEPILPPWDGGWEWTPEMYSYRLPAMLDLASAALSCRVSQIVSFQTDVPPIEMLGGVGDYHHDFAHQSAPGASQDKVDVVTAQGAAHAGQVALMADKLAAIPEDGGTVMDNTIILWISEIATGGHTHDQVPVVMLAGKNTPFATGRYLRFGQTTPRPIPQGQAWYPEGLVGQPYNPLLVSVIQAMGGEQNHFGRKSITGTFPGGDTVEIGLTGTMARLYG